MAGQIVPIATAQVLWVEAPTRISENGYVMASCGPRCSYLLSRDGIVDRVVSGRVEARWNDGARYVSVVCGPHCSYFVRSDGALDRKQGNNVARVNPPPGRRYVAIACGNGRSYLVRDDGVAERKSGGHPGKTIEFYPPKGSRYISAACGPACSV